VFASFFSVVISACDGARSVPLEYIEVAKSFRARPVFHAARHRAAVVAADLMAGIRLAADAR